jgi:hypothetical protein
LYFLLTFLLPIENEERELKKKEEDEEAAKVYETFVASFNQDEGGKSFVSKNDGQLVQLGGKDRGGVPPSSSSASTSSSSGGSGIQRRGTGGRRQMDDFLEEIKVRFEQFQPITIPHHNVILTQSMLTSLLSTFFPSLPLLVHQNRQETVRQDKDNWNDSNSDRHSDRRDRCTSNNQYHLKATITFLRL